MNLNEKGDKPMSNTIDTYAEISELMNTWNRPDAMEFVTVAVDQIVPPYRALMESYDKAQSVQRDGRETKLDRQMAPV
jgi:hypothetical protein